MQHVKKWRKDVPTDNTDQSADDRAYYWAIAEGANRVRKIADYGNDKGQRWADYFPTHAAAVRFHGWLEDNELYYEVLGIWPDGAPNFTWSVRYRVK